jgi:hypothetical protein
LRHYPLSDRSSSSIFDLPLHILLIRKSKHSSHIGKLIIGALGIVFPRNPLELLLVIDDHPFSGASINALHFPTAAAPLCSSPCAKAKA